MLIAQRYFDVVCVCVLQLKSNLPSLKKNADASKTPLFFSLQAQLKHLVSLDLILLAIMSAFANPLPH